MIHLLKLGFPDILDELGFALQHQVLHLGNVCCKNRRVDVSYKKIDQPAGYQCTNGIYDVTDG
ncbi:hypothetical protein D3C87_2176210 [compost metagenome]